MRDFLLRCVAAPAGVLARLLRRPGYTATITLTLALGIGAVTAVFALVHTVVLSALPFPQADSLLLVRQKNANAVWNTSVADFRGIQEFGTAFESAAAMRAASALTGSGESAEWRAARWITADFFKVVGVSPKVGRAPLPGDDRPGADNVVVLGHAFAQRQFAGRGNPLGQSITIDGAAYTVIGIMPPGFEQSPVVSADFWPVMQLATPERRGPFMLSTLVRLRDGVSRQVASDDLATVSRRLFPLWQQGFNDESARLSAFAIKDVVVAGAADFLWTAMGAVIVLLLIVLVNNTNLLLMRMVQRAHEQDVRAALGASRWHLARTQIGENLMLTLLGGISGLLLAILLLAGYRALGPALPRLAEVELSPAVLGFVALLVMACGLVLALVPALGRSLETTASRLQSRSASAGRHGRRFRDGLVVLEFALALPLMVAAGLLVDNLVRLQHVDPGFDADHVLTLRVRLPESGYPDTPMQLRLWADAVSALQAVPGVSALGLTGVMPPACGCYNNFEIVGQPSPNSVEPQAPWVPVDAGYFDVTRLRLIDGRLFDSRDTPESDPVVVVSEAWSKRHVPVGSAVGKQLFEGGDRSRPVTIVGVVSDVRYDGLENPGVVVFAPVSQGWSSQQLHVVARTTVAPLALAAQFRTTLQRLDPALVPTEMEALDALLADSLGNQRHWATVITVFAASALALAALGVFAMLAYQIAQRQREIGIRQALGADGKHIVRLVLWRGLRCAVSGLMIGSVIAFFLTRGMNVLLSQIDRSDPGAWVAAWLLLLAIGTLACWLPARRAARVRPLDALRQD